MLHNNIQTMIQSLMKFGGVSSKEEAVNFLIRQVGDPHITNYVDYVTSHPSAHNAHHIIVTDIMVHNYLTYH